MTNFTKSGPFHWCNKPRCQYVVKKTGVQCENPADKHSSAVEFCTRHASLGRKAKDKAAGITPEMRQAKFADWLAKYELDKASKKE